MAKQPIENIHTMIQPNAVRVYVRRKGQRTREYTPTYCSLGRLARTVRQQNAHTIPYRDGWSAFPHSITTLNNVKATELRNG